MFARASAYFLARTTRNRTAGMLRRLRQPKYLVGLVLTVAYFWFLFFANPAFRQPDGDPARARENTHLIVGAFYLLQVVVVWFSLGSGRGVAFREAEVQILFPRPFTRWQVLLLKWMAAQFPSLIGALIVGFMFLRFGDYSYPCVVAGFLLNQTALYANATLFGLWLAHLKGKRGFAARLTRLPAWALVLGLAACAASGLQGLGAGAGWDGFRALLDTEPVQAFLWPFIRLAAVMTATDAASFARAAAFPIALIAIQVIVIRWSDFAFEDQAVDLAQRIQRMRSEGVGALRAPETSIVTRPNAPWNLAPTGPAWVALVWKNVISVGRLPRRAWIRMLIVLLVTGAFLTSVLVEDADLASGFGIVILILVFYGSILAPSLVRVDLRIDIPHFDVLKAMPLRGRALVLGEVMGTVAVLFACQAIGCVLAFFLVSRVPGPADMLVLAWTDRALGLLVLLCGFFALDFALVTVENLIALWLPGFARLGRGLRPGFDQMGQNLLGALIRLLAVLVLFLFPAAIGTLLGAVLDGFGVALAGVLAAAALLAAVALVAEAGLLIVLSDGRYQRFDLSSEKLTEEE